MTVTVAPGKTPPWSSLIVPSTVALVDCAKVADGQQRRREREHDKDDVTAEKTIRRSMTRSLGDDVSIWRALCHSGTGVSIAEARAGVPPSGAIVHDDMRGALPTSRDRDESRGVSAALGVASRRRHSRQSTTTC